MLSAASTFRSGSRLLVSRKVGHVGVGSSSVSSFAQRTSSSSLLRSTSTTPATGSSLIRATAIKLASVRTGSLLKPTVRQLGGYSLRSGLEPLKREWKKIVGGLVAVTGGLQVLYGQQDNYDDKRFILEGIDPDDLADFYGSENFMDLYNIFPFMAVLMMRMGYFDDEGTVHTQGLPFGELLVSMVFSDSDDNEIDGDTTVGKWFNKRERFKNECFGGRYLMWDMMSNFGFETLPDGRCMVYHHGEYFNGNLPPLSLIMRLVFTVHSWIVVRTTKHHLTHYAFKNDTKIDETMEHDSRDCMLLFWLMNYNPLRVLKYLFLDGELDMPNHLKKKRALEMVQYKIDNPEEDEDEEEEKEEEEEEDEEVVAIKLARKKTIADTALSKTHTLPVQRDDVKRQISMDIAMDKAFAQATLTSTEDNESGEVEVDEEDEAVDALIHKKTADAVEAGDVAKTPIAMAQKRATLRRVATSTALKRFQTSLNRGPTHTDETVVAGLKRHATKIVKDFTEGNFSDEKDTGTNDKDNYKAVGLVARAKLVQRRATRMQRRSTALVRADKVDKLISFEIKKNKLDNAYGGYK